MKRFPAFMSFAATMLGLLANLYWASPAAARQWNPDTRGASLDYTQIVHAKANGEIILVWWAVPETFPGDANTKVLKDVLARYVIIGVAHGHNGAGGVSLDPVGDLKITDQSSRELSPFAANVTPAEVTQALTTLQALGRQSLGPLGPGMRWFAFESSMIHSCTAGKISVPFGGEIYTYDTPIPGCAK
jgi:hypothetical protein